MVEQVPRNPYVWLGIHLPGNRTTSGDRVFCHALYCALCTAHRKRRNARPIPVSWATKTYLRSLLSVCATPKWPLNGWSWNASNTLLIIDAGRYGTRFLMPSSFYRPGGIERRQSKRNCRFVSRPVCATRLLESSYRTSVPSWYFPDWIRQLIYRWF